LYTVFFISHVYVMCFAIGWNDYFKRNIFLINLNALFDLRLKYNPFLLVFSFANEMHTIGKWVKTTEGVTPLRR